MRGCCWAESRPEHSFCTGKQRMSQIFFQRKGVGIHGKDFHECDPNSEMLREHAYIIPHPRLPRSPVLAFADEFGLGPCLLLRIVFTSTEGVRLQGSLIEELQHSSQASWVMRKRQSHTFVLENSKTPPTPAYSQSLGGEAPGTPQGEAVGQA